MFTHLFELFVSGIDTMPGLMVYAAVALWVGAENVGIPLPLELMLLFSGSLIAFGELSFGFVLGTVVVASLAFAAFAYMIGRRTGTSGVLRLGRFVGLTQTRINHIDAWLRQRGALGVILARIIPGIRLFSSYVMGIADIAPSTFAVGTLIGSACYISIWLVAGTLLGSNYRAPLRYLDQLGLYGLVLILLALAAAFVIHQVWGHRNLHHLAKQYALQTSSPTDVNMSSQAVASALPHTQANDHLLVATEAPQMPLASVATSRERHGVSLSGDRTSELLATRQAMRAAAARLWPTWLARTLVGAWIVAFLLFVALAAAARQSAAFPIDLSLSPWLRQLNTIPLGLPITFLGDLNGPMGVTIAYIILLSLLAIIRFFREALCLAISGLGAATSNVVVNGVIARPRPPGYVAQTFANVGAYSFPSGHTAHCVGLYGFVFYLATLAAGTLPARSRWRPWLIAIQVVCVVFILDVGISRVVEGQHWPSDVVGGYLVGGLFLLIGIAIYHALAERDAQVAPHGVLPHVTGWVQPVWTPVSATTTHILRDVNTADRHVADDVGLRDTDLQAQFRRPWPSWTITLVSAAWVELATVALIVSVFAHRYATFPIDGSLATTVQRLRGTPWAALIYPAGDLQWYLPTAIAYALILGTLLGLRLYLAALFTALSSFGTDIINVAINAVVARPRPHGVSIATLTGGRLGSASFPSGHVAHTIGLYGFVFFLCILAMRAQPRLKPWLFAIQAVCLYFICFVGASRVLEGQHWPSDVAGGYLVGILVLALVIVLYHLTAMRASARHGAVVVETERRMETSVASS